MKSAHSSGARARTPERDEGPGAKGASARTPEQSEGAGAKGASARTPEQSEGAGAKGASERTANLGGSGSGPGRGTRAFVAWTLKYGWVLWAVALVLAIPATSRTVSLYLHLRSDIEELLPRESLSVRA